MVSPLVASGVAEGSRFGTLYTTNENSLLTFPLSPSHFAVAWVGKTPLRPLGRPQDRSGSPTKGAKLTGGNLPDCRLRADSPFPQIERKCMCQTKLGITAVFCQGKITPVF
ncbi:MAG: hypothetical protein ACHBN1_03020 [Heteroscytonema crispum UTEX LB 1556]